MLALVFGLSRASHPIRAAFLAAITLVTLRTAGRRSDAQFKPRIRLRELGTYVAVPSSVVAVCSGDPETASWPVTTSVFR